MAVASAAPVSPMFIGNMKTASKIMFRIQPLMVESIAILGAPSALTIGFSTFNKIKNGIPIRIHTAYSRDAIKAESVFAPNNDKIEYSRGKHIAKKTMQIKMATVMLVPTAFDIFSFRKE